MPAGFIPFWKKVPFIRLAIALVAGILIQWYVQLPASWLWTNIIVAMIFFGLFFFISLFHKYKHGFVNGIIIFLLIAGIGALITWHKDIRHDTAWLGNNYSGKELLLVRVEEPLIEKSRSFKTKASVILLQRGQKRIAIKGTIFLYFRKDYATERLTYGAHLIIRQPLQEIRNSGNPGAFDYRRHSLFQGITHQVFLEQGQFEILSIRDQNIFKRIIFRVREKVIEIIRSNISDEKEAGLAEALLIGYKDDLDKNLVQSYSKTGVVHVIAISGLHLGLIYWLLMRFLGPLGRLKKLRWLRPILILAALWSFTLLAGAQASVLRSALMFSCFVTSEGFGRKSNIFNSLAFSAFILLCINPFWLWDPGFQLSYTAVLSIVIFMRPIYNLFYFRNKVIDLAWKMNAVTIAAQLLTTPFCIFHFHQFPNYFILSNFIAVPLSSLILLGAVVLCLIAGLTGIAIILGKALTWAIQGMNGYIELLGNLPFSVWENLQTSISQTLLLFLAVAGIGIWLLEKSKHGIKMALMALLAFMILRSYSLLQANRQQRIIVYNIPQKRALDFIDGRNYYFLGDSSLLTDELAIGFHLKPARTLYRISQSSRFSGITINQNCISYKSLKLLLLDKGFTGKAGKTRQRVDLLVVSGRSKLSIIQLASQFEIRQVVFDASASARKLKYLKMECDSLSIPYHDVRIEGAFVMNLP